MTAPLLVAQDGDAAFRKLMASPVDAPRKRMRKAKAEPTVETVEPCKSLADVLRASQRGKRLPISPLLKPVPTYAQWLRSFMNADDARREDARAKAEWAAIKEFDLIRASRDKFGVQTRPHQGAREIARRRKHQPVTQTTAPPKSLADSIRRTVKPAASRSSWPSFRPAQLDAIYAIEGIAGLASVGATLAEIESRTGAMQAAA